jgi:polar amino acid transport system substrate-binding protein
MRSLRTIVFGTLSALAVGLPAMAETAYVANNPPYSIQSGEQRGFCVEVIDEMAKLLKTKVTLEYMGWADAQAKVLAGHGVFIFPFARTPEREPNYTWLQKLFDIEVGFISAPGSQPIDTIEQAKALPAVGVLAGSPWDKELAKRGIATAKPYLTTPAIVAAVASGEVAAGYAPDIELKYAWRTSGIKGVPVFGKAIQKLDQFLAMSKDSPSIKQADWQEAFNVLQQDGTFDRIYASYFGKK